MGGGDVKGRRGRMNRQDAKDAKTRRGEKEDEDRRGAETRGTTRRRTREDWRLATGDW
jgi:hypothetical protein